MTRSEWLASLKNGDLVRFGEWGEWVVVPIVKIVRIHDEALMDLCDFASVGGYETNVDPRHPERSWTGFPPETPRGPIQPLDRVLE